MKIGLVVDDGLDKPDGVQQFVLTLGKWLSENGHEVHYITSSTKRIDLPNLHVLSKSLTVSFNGNKLRVPLPAPRSKVRNLLNNLDLDVLHVQMPYSPFLGGRVIMQAKDTHVIGTFHILPYGKIAFFGSKLLGFFQKMSLQRVNYITSTSAPTKHFAESAFGISSEVIANPVSLKSFKGTRMSVKPNDELTIVYLGRLVERKGVMQFLMALNKLKTENLGINFKVKIGGKGPLLEKLEQYSLNNVLNFVEFVGFIDEKLKPDFLCQADLAVFPATSGESFGIVLIEAMAVGSCAVIGGNNPGYNSVLSPWPETIFDPNDTEGFANKLKLFLTDHKLRDSVRKSQSIAVKDYDISVIGSKFVDIYHKTLQTYRHLR